MLNGRGRSTVVLKKPQFESADVELVVSSSGRLWKKPARKTLN